MAVNNAIFNRHFQNQYNQDRTQHHKEVCMLAATCTKIVHVVVKSEGEGVYSLTNIIYSSCYQALADQGDDILVIVGQTKNFVSVVHA